MSYFRSWCPCSFKIQHLKQLHLRSLIQCDTNYIVGKGVSKELKVATKWNEQKNEIEQISIVVNVATFNSGLSSRDSHMMEVLDGLTYPRIIFSSSSVQYTPEGILVKGKLQFHGVERMIETKVKLEKQNRKLVFSGSLPVLLEDYKVERPGLLFVKVDNLVKIDFQVVYNN